MEIINSVNQDSISNLKLSKMMVPYTMKLDLGDGIEVEYVKELNISSERGGTKHYQNNLVINL